MAKDHFAKQPTQNEIRFERLEQAVQQMYQIFGDIDRRLTAMARAKFDPETFVKFMLDGDANKEFMGKVNEQLEIQLREKELQAREAAENNKKVAEQFAAAE